MQKQMQRRQSTFHIFRMFFRLLLIITSLIGTFFLVCIALAKAMQREELRNRIRSFNKRRLNPVVLHTIAGDRSRIYACIKHVGRRSSKEYETPVVARPLGDGFVIPLPYGANVDWCRNVMAAGTCTMYWNGQEYTLERPELIRPAEALDSYPLVQRIIFASGGIIQYLLLHEKQESLAKTRVNM